MPELPEVETTRRGIEPLVVGRTVREVILRVAKLRWPIPPSLAQTLCGRRILGVGRRAKYLLLHCTGGTVILHLGMSGHLRVVPDSTPAARHDHIELLLSDGASLRFNDSRRFGAFLWSTEAAGEHPLLAGLGPEPVAGELDGAYLHRRSRGRRLAVKPFLMDQKVVVGVGNIYASEALFRARIHPERCAGELSLAHCGRLAVAVHAVMAEAIAAGGTTLRDFSAPDGRPGYFRQQLQVYGRAGQPCPICGAPVLSLRLGGRATYFCARCQV